MLLGFFLLLCLCCFDIMRGKDTKFYLFNNVCAITFIVYCCLLKEKNKLFL